MSRKSVFLTAFVILCGMGKVQGFVSPASQPVVRSGGMALQSSFQPKQSKPVHKKTKFLEKPDKITKPRNDASLDSDIRNQIDKFDPFHFRDSKGKLSPSQVTTKADVEEKKEDGGMGIWSARGLLLLVAMLWGTNFASVKYLETLCFNPPCNHPPSEAALARFGVAALVSLPLLIGKRMDVILGGLECGIWITLGYITQAAALQSIGAGKCAFICSLTVVVVPLIETLFGKKLKLVNVASAIIALAGVGVLEGLIDIESVIQPAMAEGIPTTAAMTETVAETSSTLVSNAATESTSFLTSIANTLGVNKGDLLALGQPLGFGFSFLRIEHYVEKFEKVENRVMTIAAAQCVAVAICSLLWVLMDFGGHIPDFGYMMEPHRLTAVAWTGIMTTVVAIYFEGVALQVASATEAAITFATEPVWASLFGAYLLHEKLGTSAYVGGAIITLACLLGSVADLTSAKEKKEAIEAE